MLLAVDIGNTNIVFAVHDGQRFVGSWRCRTDSERSADEYAVLLSGFFATQGLSRDAIQDVIISSVVPAVNPRIELCMRQYLDKAPLMATRDIVGIPVDLDRPEEAGADRLLNALALTSEYQAPGIVLDFGTATTFDVVDVQGRYAGGVIAPGIGLSLEALHKAAARLPAIDVEKPAGVIGKNTVSAMQSGIFWGYAALIEGIIERITHEMDVPSVFVLATGGLAPLFSAHLPVINHVDQELTLKGLVQVHAAHGSR